MRALQMFGLGLVVVALTAGPAFPHGGGGGGGAGGGGAGAGGHGVDGAAVGHSDATANGPTRGSGRDTAISAPGSQHRSDNATTRLSTTRPGKAHPPSGVNPGQGKTGTAPMTPGQR